MRSTMMSCPLLVTSMLARGGGLFSEVEVVSARADGSRSRHTVGALHRRSRQLSACLQDAGVAKGDRVATMMWNSQEHLECYFGVPAVGAVLHTLNMRLHPDELACIVNHAQDRFLIVDDVLLPLLERIHSRVKFERIFVVNHGGGLLPEGGESYEAFLAGSDREPDYPLIAEEDAAAMCYTSGTTGQPKGVLYSHRALCLHSLAISLPDQLDISRHDTILPITPMFHANAWGLPYAAIMNGSKLVLPGPNLQPAALLNLMQEEQVTLTCAVPTIWLGILKELEEHPDRWALAKGLRVVIGGSAVPESMIRRFDKLGIRVIHAFGMTETSPVITACTLKPHMSSWAEDKVYAQRAMQGLALPFIEVRAAGEAGEAAWDGETMGELEVRGPWVAGSYQGADQHDRWTADGWFKTGDVVTIDGEGYVKITDRMKDLIKSGGEWISSVDLENALIGHDAIKEAAVIAVPHPKWLERPLALVVLQTDCAIDPGELRRFLEQRFARWQVPDAFVFVRELPYTSTGKVLKSKLRRDYHDWQWGSQ
jgi:fatty-acyl-CoA synthase